MQDAENLSNAKYGQKHVTRKGSELKRAGYPNDVTARVPLKRALDN